jgi:hypothetical protein
MATLPRAAVDAYTERLDALSEAARRVVAAQLAAIEYEDVADLREQVIAILEPVCAASSEAAAAYAAEFYDEVRAAQAGVPLGAEAVSAHLPEATERAVRSIVQIVVDGKPWEQFARAVEDRADYEVKASAGECVKANAARDPLRPRWARVPDGSETCPFCIMLASRGFVYASEKTASEKEGGGHYHPNCRCRVVPGFPGMEVEGYDPDGLYRRWRESEKAKGRRPATPSSVRCEDGAEPMPKEMAVAEWLAGRGFDVEFRATRSSQGLRTSDILIGGEPWEIKQPTGTGRRNISNQFNAARGQSDKLVIDVSKSPLERREIETEAWRQLTLRDDFTEVILIGEGYMKRYKK